MTKQKSTRNKEFRTSFLLTAILLGILLGLAIISSQHQRQFKNEVVTPTLPEASITHEASNTTRIRIPAYGVNVHVPVALKTSRELDPTSSYTEISPYHIALYTPDSEVSKQSGYQLKGVRVSFSIHNEWKDFGDPNTVGPVNKNNIDLSALPNDNPLISNNNARVYSSSPFSDSAAWYYIAEVKLNKEDNKSGHAIGFYIYCLDFNNDQTPSIACHDIIKNSLASFSIN